MLQEKKTTTQVVEVLYSVIIRQLKDKFKKRITVIKCFSTKVAQKYDVNKVMVNITG